MDRSAVVKIIFPLILTSYENSGSAVLVFGFVIDGGGIAPIVGVRIGASISNPEFKFYADIGTGRTMFG